MRQLSQPSDCLVCLIDHDGEECPYKQKQDYSSTSDVTIIFPIPMTQNQKKPFGKATFTVIDEGFFEEAMLGNRPWELEQGTFIMDGMINKECSRMTYTWGIENLPADFYVTITNDFVSLISSTPEDIFPEDSTEIHDYTATKEDCKEALLDQLRAILEMHALEEKSEEKLKSLTRRIEELLLCEYCVSIHTRHMPCVANYKLGSVGHTRII